jgi:hypothetical protein
MFVLKSATKKIVLYSFVLQRNMFRCSVLHEQENDSATQPIGDNSSPRTLSIQPDPTEQHVEWMAVSVGCTRADKGVYHTDAM